MLRFLERIRARDVLRKKRIAKRVVKLHIGCGTDYKFGWVNIDNNSDKNIKKLDLNWDLRWGLPFPDSSVEFIYNEHFLEHLTVEEGLKMLSECRRTLKTGGILRVAMPDLKVCMEDYFNPDWKSDPRFDAFKFVKTRAEMINLSFRWWGHQHLYDEEELKRRLLEVGFEKIKFCSLGESEKDDLRDLEVRDSSILIAEATK